MQRCRLVDRFTAAEVRGAFAALRTHAPALYASRSTHAVLGPVVHHRDGADQRDHVELPLQHMYDATAAYRAIPAEVRGVCEGLHAAAVAYVQESLQHHQQLQRLCASAEAQRELLAGLGKKSVLRVLRYPAGSGCRPHVDPGLCTALLCGSAGGLEVNLEDELPASFTAGRRPGDFTEAVAGTASALDTLPHWTPVTPTHAGEAVVMAGNLLGVVTHGALPGVLHRVRRDWGASQRTAASDAVDGAEGGRADSAERYNIIVELRPAKARRWYAAAAAAAAPSPRWT